MKVDEATDYMPVMERNNNPTAHDEMLRLLEVCATLTADMRRLDSITSELQDTCHRQAQQLAASQHYAQQLREVIKDAFTYDRKCSWEAKAREVLSIPHDTSALDAQTEAKGIKN